MGTYLENILDRFAALSISLFVVYLGGTAGDLIWWCLTFFLWSTVCGQGYSGLEPGNTYQRF